MKNAIFILCLLFITSTYAQCDPFTLHCRENSNVLIKYPLENLRLAGILSKAGQWWAIIETPNKDVYALKQGDTLGLEGGRVLQISSQQILIQQEKKVVVMELK